MADDNVTLAVLQNDIGYLREAIAALRGETQVVNELVARTAQDCAKRITVLELQGAADCERWKAHNSRHEREAKLYHAASFLEALTAGLIGLRGWFV